MSKTLLRRRLTPPIPFTLKWEDCDGAEQSLSLRLSYDFNAFVLIEEKLGVSMLTGAGEILDAPTAKNVSVLLWAAMQEYHPEYEGEQGLWAVRSIVTLPHVLEVNRACSETYFSQLSKASQKAIEEARKKAEAAVIAGEPILPLATSPTPTPTE